MDSPEVGQRGKTCSSNYLVHLGAPELPLMGNGRSPDPFESRTSAKIMGKTSRLFLSMIENSQLFL